MPSAPRGWCISSLVCWHGAQHLSASVFLMGGGVSFWPQEGSVCSVFPGLPEPPWADHELQSEWKCVCASAAG